MVLFSLWDSLICEYTYLAKAAVTLLCDCLEFLVIPVDVQAKEMDLQQTKFRSMVDSKFEQDSHTKRFEVGMHEQFYKILIFLCCIYSWEGISDSAVCWECEKVVNAVTPIIIVCFLPSCWFVARQFLPCSNSCTILSSVSQKICHWGK